MDTGKTFLQYEKEVAEFKLQLIRRMTKGTGPAAEEIGKRTFKITMAENVLAAAGRPLHIADIIAVAEKDLGVSLDRDSLSSALSKQVRKGKRFVRTDPNTFGLRQR
ncbi:MAG: winged helix-turn-helix domain-containing protein [Deferrisomatales bacterium]|nr:winged helix-turn-helix domain-containing protein [Deferrisomatales bacterium]